ncbi:hypothetical protein [Actinomadura welshii]|uniref:hypothetical protein n=1 Tax=Actinomadura welshii TaxID=3103817 RepID=UPI0003ACF6DC|nr:hypothetical protein [Actinomadura madurae]
MNVKALLTRVLPVVAVAVVAVTLGSGTASAATWEYGPWRSETKGATAWFTKKGDHLKICDTKSDGHRAMAWVYVGQGKNATYRFDLPDTKNDGKCKYSDASMGGRFNLPEKKWIQIQVCVASSVGCYDGVRTFEIYNDH